MGPAPRNFGPWGGPGVVVAMKIGHSAAVLALSRATRRPEASKSSSKAWAMDEPLRVRVSELVKALVQELDEREDEADWELEEFSKAHVLQQLAAVESAEYLRSGLEVRLVVKAGAKAVVDLAPGVVARFQEVGSLGG